VAWFGDPRDVNGRGDLFDHVEMAGTEDDVRRH
jgi:hypothetical protein